MADLEDAILHAVRAHRGAVDEDGSPRVLHPLRVMLTLRTETERTVGVLHEVLEATGQERADLEAAGYPPEVVEAVDCLTRREGEPREAFLDRIKANSLACSVKIADLEDGMDLSRPAPGGDDRTRLEDRWAELKELVACCPPVR